MTNAEDLEYIRQTVELARNGVENNEGGPFGSLVVKDGKVIGKGNNQVTSTNDPTAHAEVVAIRDACQNLQSFQLEGCTLYTSCEPCPMCLGAIYWARPDRVVYACSRGDASVDFDDEFIYKEINVSVSERKIPMHQCGRETALGLFDLWRSKKDKTAY